MQITRHAIDWFEIPVRDMSRAAAFYEALLATSIRRENNANSTLGAFSHDDTGVGGCLIAEENAPAPSTSGTLSYLGAGPSLDAVLARVERLGGRITTPKVTLPGDMGCFAHIADTEGNRVGLHAPA
jgi:predicted enzyme related to lactoylglutathione lyase